MLLTLFLTLSLCVPCLIPDSFVGDIHLRGLAGACREESANKDSSKRNMQTRRRSTGCQAASEKQPYTPYGLLFLAVQRQAVNCKE
ncbi:hypothetical protein J6590_035845 [Homalodisca vitripennis]|nr:hypothetical protein J6590_035845 [Homalodisca vitripennis]